MSSMYDQWVMIMEACEEVETLLKHAGDQETSIALATRASKYILWEAELFAHATRADIQACVKEMLLSQLLACSEEEHATPEQVTRYMTEEYVKSMTWRVVLRQHQLQQYWKHRN